MQKAFPEGMVRVAVADLFFPNLLTILRIRSAPITSRMSIRKLNEGMFRRRLFHRHKCWKRIAILTL